MIETYTDDSGVLHIFAQGDFRQGPPGTRRGRGFPGRRRGGGRQIVVHQPQGPLWGNQPWGQTWTQPAPAFVPAPVPAPTQENQGMDMRTALDSLGALLPAVGKMIAAFRHPPDRPKLTGDPTKDIATVMDFVAENFDHARAGAQTAGVLATTGAVMEILASL